MILLFLLQHSEAARTDRMFRSGLSSLTYAPAKPLSSTQIRQAAAEAPSSAGIFVAAHRVALTTATIAGVAGGVCAWQVARIALNDNPLPEPTSPVETSVSVPVDSLAPTKIPVEEPETATPSERPEAKNKPEIIVVTKEIVVNDTVVVRDTAILKDTVYLMQKP